MKIVNTFLRKYLLLLTVIFVSNGTFSQIVDYHFNEMNSFKDFELTNHQSQSGVLVINFDLNLVILSLDIGHLPIITVFEITHVKEKTENSIKLDLIYDDFLSYGFKIDVGEDGYYADFTSQSEGVEYLSRIFIELD